MVDNERGENTGSAQLYGSEGLDAMDQAQFVEAVQGWANDILVWVGFGTLVGLLAKAVMPGRDPGGAVATLAMGIGGTIIGCGALSYCYTGQRVTPISLLGLVVGTAGAFVLLFFYRLLGGYLFSEGGTLRRRTLLRRPRRARRYETAHYVDVE